MTDGRVARPPYPPHQPHGPRGLARGRRGGGGCPAQRPFGELQSSSMGCLAASLVSLVFTSCLTVLLIEPSDMTSIFLLSARSSKPWEVCVRETSSRIPRRA